MNSNEFYEVGLYEHNAEAYKKVRAAYESGETVVGIVHATGTGKTYIASQLAKDNKGKKILWVVPNNSISEHVENIIANNPNLSREVDFENVEFRTYQSFINMTREELSEIDCDLLILDEFHHIGAPVWGARIKTIVETHPEMLVFGMTAYTIIGRGTPYERDMADPDGGELFSGKIVSRYDIVDAVIDGVLPRDVIYRTSYDNLFSLEDDLKDKIQKMIATKEELEEYKKIMATVKKRIAEAPGIEDVVKKYVKPNGKYFYFCPPRSEDGTNDINTIMKEAYKWFSSYVPEEDIVFYSTTSGMREEGRHNREMFYNDLTLDGKEAKKKLRVMFAINQYNEGVHAPNVDGVIMGRGTSSDIVYFEQLGRALSVRGDTYEKYNEYSKYSYDELVSLAKNKEIIISADMTKEDIIEKLVSPVIIDLTNNIGFIKELEDNIKYRVRERREKGLGTRTSVKLREVSFDIDIFNEDLYKILSSLRNKVYKDWDAMYELAKKYYEHHGNLKIKRTFRTLNGYEHDDNGAHLGAWINTQRYAYKEGKLSKDRIEKLNKIGMIFKVRQNYWEKMYSLAKKYYEEHGNLNIADDFVIKDENGEIISPQQLQEWISIQQKSVATKELLSVSKRRKLKLIGITFDSVKIDWNFMFKLAREYNNHYKNLDIPTDFKTINGYKYNENGYPLGEWFALEKEKMINGKQTESRVMKWEGLGFDVTAFLGSFEKMISLASRYFDVYRHLDIPSDFRTTDGVYYDENGYLLGAWILMQKNIYRQGRLKPDRKNKLEKCGMIFDNSQEQWLFMYNKAKEYYEINKNLKISHYYVTDDGYFLGAWLYHQKHLIGEGKLDNIKIRYMQDIGIINGFRSGLSRDDWDLMYELAEKHFNKYGNLSLALFDRFVTLDGITEDSDGYNLGVWLINNIKLLEENNLPDWKENKLYKIGIIDKEKEKVKVLRNLVKNEWDTMYLLASNFYEKNGNLGNLNVPIDFKTYDGIEYDEDGIELGKWVLEQKSLFNQGKLSDEKAERFSKLLKVSELVKKQIELLKKEIKMNPEEEWDFMYKMAKTYYDKYKHLLIPLYFTTFDGDNYADCGYPLGSWLEEQKKLYFDDKLSTEKVDKLYDLGISFSIEDTMWHNSYMNTKAYYEHYGNLNVPHNFVTDDGINESKTGTNLYIWIKKQVDDLLKENSSSYKKEKLREIGISKEKIQKEKSIFFEEMYEMAKTFYEKYGHVDPRICYGNRWSRISPEEESLVWWVISCKREYSKGQMDEITYKRLKDIGVFMTEHEAKWNHMFRLSREFYKYYGHLDIPFGFKTFDGIKYDEEGLELGKWIRNQRINLKNEERIDKLNTIGMIWVIRSSTKENQEICLKYGIDYKEHRAAINRISKIELISKINYLLSIDESIVVGGKLHEIFLMSSVNMKEKYGINLEDIINIYYIIDNKKRGL